jgi:hypothetical protein
MIIVCWNAGMASWRKKGLKRRKLIVALIYFYKGHHAPATTLVTYDSSRSLV